MPWVYCSYLKCKLITHGEAPFNNGNLHKWFVETENNNILEIVSSINKRDGNKHFTWAQYSWLLISSVSLLLSRWPWIMYPIYRCWHEDRWVVSTRKWRWYWPLIMEIFTDKEHHKLFLRLLRYFAWTLNTKNIYLVFFN